jgi:hypothetical protein
MSNKNKVTAEQEMRNKAFDAMNQEPAFELNNKEAAGGKRLTLLVDKVPYEVRVTPFTFNEERRYYVSVNGGEEHVFTWDTEASTLRAIDDEAADLPDSVEDAISRELMAHPM